MIIRLDPSIPLYCKEHGDGEALFMEIPWMVKVGM